MEKEMIGDGRVFSTGANPVQKLYVANLIQETFMHKYSNGVTVTVTVSATSQDSIDEFLKNNYGYDKKTSK